MSFVQYTWTIQRNASGGGETNGFDIKAYEHTMAQGGTASELSSIQTDICVLRNIRFLATAVEYMR